MFELFISRFGLVNNSGQMDVHLWQYSDSAVAGICLGVVRSWADGSVGPSLPAREPSVPASCEGP